MKEHPEITDAGIAAGTVMNRTYTHDGAGNVTGISSVTRPPIAPGTTDYSIPSGNSRVSGSTGQTAKTYAYDAAGNITSDGTRTFTYNQNHRLIQVSTGSTVTAEYAYDAFGRRVKKTAGSEITLYHYDYSGNLICETDGTGSPIRDYVYLNGEPAAMKVYGDTDAWYFFLCDHLGTPQKVVNASGAVVWEAGYMPFGEARILIADIENNLRFPGQYYDSETGLHYNWHRYYDPDTGRYLTPDPIGLEGGLNLYAYVNGNPVNWADPEGLISGGGGANGAWENPSGSQDCNASKNLADNPLYKSALEQFKKTDFTNAGRAVTKHPEYFGFKNTEALRKVYNTDEKINKLASDTLSDIIRTGKTTTGAGGRYPNGWTTITIPDGRAASWHADGRFIGFRGVQ